MQYTSIVFNPSYMKQYVLYYFYVILSCQIPLLYTECYLQCHVSVGVTQWVARLTPNRLIVGSNLFKDFRCYFGRSIHALNEST